MPFDTRLNVFESKLGNLEKNARSPISNRKIASHLYKPVEILCNLPILNFFGDSEKIKRLQ